MTRSVKAALVGATLAVVAAGCAYDDDYYGHRSYYGHSTYRDRDDSYRDRGDRVRVCDPDGDDCHWEYRH
jgi:hypothetical protein